MFEPGVERPGPPEGDRGHGQVRVPLPRRPQVAGGLPQAGALEQDRLPLAPAGARVCPTVGPGLEELGAAELEGPEATNKGCVTRRAL